MEEPLVQPSTEQEIDLSERVSLDLEELLGFNEAKRKLEESKLLPDPNAPEPTFYPNRIFINHIDSFHGKHISEFLGNQTINPVQDIDEAEEVAEEEEDEDDGNEEEDEEEIKDTDYENEPPLSPQMPFTKREIIGTLKGTQYKIPDEIKRVVYYSANSPTNNDEFMDEIMKCGVIVYDIINDPSQIEEAKFVLHEIEKKLMLLKEEDPKAFKQMRETRHFILLSTVMSWAQTKPIDPDDPDLPFTEADYRKRKPHPNFKEHTIFEKEVARVGKLFKEQLKTTILCSGITYGSEEDTLHFLFKQAWLNEPEMPIFLKGKNKIPLMNIHNLATLVNAVIERFPPSSKYIFAIEPQVNRLKSIVQSISKIMGSGQCKEITKEEAFLNPAVTQDIFDKLTVNLNMEPGYIMDNIEMNWVSEGAFAENIQALVDEYKTDRGLKEKPIKIYIHGPPAVGKTRLATRLCQHYKLHHLCTNEVISYAIAEMKAKIAKIEAKERALLEEAEKEEKEEDEEAEAEEPEAEEEEEDETVEETKEEIQEALNEIVENMAENDGRLDEELLTKIFKDRLYSRPCKNQGYVLVNYPKLLEQARALFGTEGEGDEEEAAEEEDMGGGYKAPGGFDAKIMPDHIISLVASDSFITKRIMDLTEDEIHGTRYDEEILKERLERFRENNTEDENVLDFFDELEFHPMLLDVENDSTPTMDATFKAVIERVGKPCNFGLSDEELASIERDKLRMLDQEADKLRSAEEKRRLAEELLHNNMEEWMSMWDSLKKDEEQMIAIDNMPLRHYLIQYVLPTLTKGLAEVAQSRPKNPVDFLAHYLFKENPEGKMFQPSYSAVAEEFMDAVHLLQESLQKIQSIPKVEDFLNPENRSNSMM